MKLNGETAWKIRAFDINMNFVSKFPLNFERQNTSTSLRHAKSIRTLVCS